MEQCGQLLQGQERLPHKAEELRYICGWYSIVAPVVGLPLPLGCLAGTFQRDAAERLASPPCITSVL